MGWWRTTKRKYRTRSKDQRSRDRHRKYGMMKWNVLQLRKLVNEQEKLTRTMLIESPFQSHTPTRIYLYKTWKKWMMVHSEIMSKTTDGMKEEETEAGPNVMGWRYQNNYWKTINTFSMWICCLFEIFIYSQIRGQS